MTGYLPLGVRHAPWYEVAARCGANSHRWRFVSDLLAALRNLPGAGCQSLALNGSFISQKELPEDHDGIWDAKGVNVSLLDPVLLDFPNGRATIKSKYWGELFPATPGAPFPDFFIRGRNGTSKGVVQIDPGSLP